MADDRDEKKPKRKQKRATLRPSTKLGGSFWKTNNRIVLAMATISLLLLIGSGVRSKIKENHEKACQDAKVHVEAQFKAGNTGVASNYMSTLRTACGELDRSYVDSFDRTLKEREIAEEKSRVEAIRIRIEAEQARDNAATIEAAQRRAEKVGPWSTIPRPGVDTQDTSDSRVKYMEDVSVIHPYEPPINKVAAKDLLKKLRRAMIKVTEISGSHVHVNIGEGSGSIIFDEKDDDVAVRSRNNGIVEAGACSELFLAASMIDAEISPEDFIKVGMRGLLCKSRKCSAIFDLRPTNEHGGFYAGESCVDFIKKEN